MEVKESKQRGYVIICLSVLIAILLVCFTQCRKTKLVVPINQIDSLRTVNDSIKLNIDSIDSVIINLGKDYEKNYNIILNQSADSDVSFFERYLSSHS